MTPCFFARFDPDPCRGRTDPCHLIPKQRLTQEGIEDVWDERLIVPGCRRHHDRFDGRDALHKITLSLADYPPKLLAFAQQEGFAFVDERTGWVKTSKVAA